MAINDPYRNLESHESRDYEDLGIPKSRRRVPPDLARELTGLQFDEDGRLRVTPVEGSDFARELRSAYTEGDEEWLRTMLVAARRRLLGRASPPEDKLAIRDELCRIIGRMKTQPPEGEHTKRLHKSLQRTIICSPAWRGPDGEAREAPQSATALRDAAVEAFESGDAEWGRVLARVAQRRLLRGTKLRRGEELEEALEEAGVSMEDIQGIASAEGETRIHKKNAALHAAGIPPLKLSSQEIEALKETIDAARSVFGEGQQRLRQQYEERTGKSAPEGDAPAAQLYTKGRSPRQRAQGKARGYIRIVERSGKVTEGVRQRVRELLNDPRASRFIEGNLRQRLEQIADSR